MSDLLDLPLDSLELGPRTLNPLIGKHGGSHLKSVRELVALTEREVLRTPGFGKAGLALLKQVLAERGLELRPPDHPKTHTPPLLFPSIHERLSRIEARLHALEERA